MKYIVTGDIHLGHNKTPTIHIANSFRKQILTKENQNADILFIEGDLFDRLVDTNSKELMIIIDLIHDILSYCQNNNIKLRILEGTPSHDFRQPRLVPKINELRKRKADVIYHDVLEIEHIEDLNLYVLYVPDEWTNDHSELERQISLKLKEHNITQVDIAILHGQFEYQFAGTPYQGFFYRQDYFESLVKGYIHLGHYHTASRLNRIIASGSLERLSHRQEEDKGYSIVENGEVRFIVNQDAWTYKTINVSKATSISSLEKAMRTFKPNSYIRLSLTKDHPFNINFQELKLKFPEFHLERKLKDSDSVSTTDILSEDILEVSDRFIIEGNLREIVLSLSVSKYTLNEQEASKLNHYLKVFDHAKPDITE